MQKEIRMLPDQVYGLEQREIRLRRQLPWSRKAQYEAWQAGGEKPPEFEARVSFVAPIEEKKAIRVHPEIETREFARKAGIIETKEARLKREMTQRRLAEKQAFLNKTLPID